MSSLREQIMLAVETSLNTSGGPTGLNVHRERDRAIERDTLPSILFYAQDDAPVATSKEKFHAPLVERTLNLAVEQRAQGTPQDAALDPIILWAAQRMFVDEKFGGLAMGVAEEKTVWHAVKSAETPIAAATTHFVIRYRTTRVDPSKRD